MSALNQDSSIALQNALDLYAQKKLPVVPCEPFGRKPTSATRRNSISNQSFPDIQLWQANPTLNIGLPTGSKSKIIALFVDADRGGLESIDKLPFDLYQIKTPGIHAGNGSKFLLFRHPNSLSCIDEILPGIDVIGDDGHIPLPPSKLDSNPAIKWIDYDLFLSDEMAPLPESFLDWHKLQLANRPPMPDTPIDFDAYDPKINAPTLRTLADVVPQEIDWLWSERIPLGIVTGLEGHPQAGKSWLTVHIASALSRGEALPDQLQRDPCNSLILNSEDSAEHVMRKRFESAGADLDRIGVVDEPMRLDSDGLSLLCEYIDSTAAKLVVIDPISSFMPPDVDPNKVERVRPFLANLMQIAKTKYCAIVVVRHLTKHRQSRAMLSGSGSVDFVAAYRSLLLAGSDPDDESKRALFQTKSNYGSLSAPLGYQIEGDRLVWTGATDLTPQRVMSSQRDETRLSSATRDLMQLLSQSGPTPAKEIQAQMANLGHSKSTINRAAKTAGVNHQRNGFQGQVTWSKNGE